MTRCYPLAFIFSLSLALTSVVAQQEEEGFLYFPPELTVLDAKRWINLHTDVEANTAPLLPLVFFEAGESDFPERYQIFNSSIETDAYTDTTGLEAWSDVDMYLDVLNIIGYRMQRLPGTTIELEGGCSTEPGENLDLGLARAEVVRDYLINVWKIEAERIVLRSPRLMCDASDNIFLQEEAQRVEIHPSDFALVRSVRYRGRAYHIASPEFKITLTPNTETPADVAAIEVVLRAGDSILNRTQVPGSPDSTLYRLHCSWMTTAEFFKESNWLEIYALVHQTDGTTRTSKSVRIPITITTDTSFYDVSNYGRKEVVLPFFFANQTDLTPLQIRLLDELMLRHAVNHPESWEVEALTVHAKTEAGEYGSEDKDLLYSRRSEHRSLQNQLDDIYGSGAWDAPMFLHSAENKVAPSVMSRLHGGEEKNLERISAAVGELSAHHLDTKMGLEVYQFLESREREVASYLNAHYVETGKCDTVILTVTRFSKETFSNWDGLRAHCHYTPEERFYRRAVSIMIDYSYRSYRSDDEETLNYDFIEKVDVQTYPTQQIQTSENEEYNEDED